MKKIALFYLAMIVSLPAASPDLPLLLKKNIFTKPVPPKEPVKFSILKPQPIPPLDSLLEVKGIIYAPEIGSLVIIRLKNQNEESIFKQGEIVCSGVVINRIEEKKVLFEYEGNQVILSLPETTGTTAVATSQPASVASSQPPGSSQPVTLPLPASSPASPIPVATEPVSVPLAEVLEEMKKDRDILSNFQVAPHISESGRVEGFRVSNIPENSLAYKYGLRSGDVIRRVNGVLIDSLAKAFSVYQQIMSSNAKNVSVEVLRNNNPVLLNYRLQ
ncbi:MAG: PDZ domain-containing protein [Candidatus Omnitrophica bacterium]|nr:PDZ domain-containing protein [Candidatus Omnitrophota bacterium]